MKRIDLTELKNERFLSQGAANRIFVACWNEKEVVVKKAKNPERSNLLKEYGILDALDGGFVPEVYGLFSNSDELLIVEELIRGRHPGNNEEAFTASFARQLSSFHRKYTNAKIDGMPEYMAGIFLKTHIEEVFKRYNPKFPESVRESIGNNIDKASHILGKYLHLFMDVSPTLVHGDLIPLNMLVEESGSIRVIDWENARMDCAEFDVATFLKGFHANENIRRIFLGSYDNGLDPYRLRICEALHNLQVSAWRVDIYSGLNPDEHIHCLEEECRVTQDLLDFS